MPIHVGNVVEGEGEVGGALDFGGDASEHRGVEQEEVADVELAEPDEVRLQAFLVG